MTAKTFQRFDRLSEDLARGKHDWFSHKLKLVFLAAVPDKSADSTGRGVHSAPLTHTAAREGRTTSVTIQAAMVRAEGDIAPFAAVAVVNATTNAPIGFLDMGEAKGMEDGSSKEFKFPPDVVMITV